MLNLSAACANKENVGRNDYGRLQVPDLGDVLRIRITVNGNRGNVTFE